MYFRKNTGLRVIRTVVFVLTVAVAVSGVWIYIDFRLKSVALNFAKSAAKTAVINCANIASERALGELGITYDQLARITRNEEGLATSVEIDSVTANRFKSYISNEIAEELVKHEAVSFSVPASAAFGIYYTGISCPKINYTVHITTTAASNITSSFTTAGINQVLHQIIMEVTLESDLAMRAENTEQVATTEFIIAQTVIVGAVPDAFTNVGHATDEIIEDIFDFGAEIF